MWGTDSDLLQGISMNVCWQFSQTSSILSDLQFSYISLYLSTNTYSTLPLPLRTSVRRRLVRDLSRIWLYIQCTSYSMHACAPYIRLKRTPASILPEISLFFSASNLLFSVFQAISGYIENGCLWDLIQWIKRHYLGLSPINIVQCNCMRGELENNLFKLVLRIRHAPKRAWLATS